MSDATGTTGFQYDAMGRLKTKTSPAGRISYEYNDTAPRRTLTVRTFNQDGNARPTATGLGGATFVCKRHAKLSITHIFSRDA